MTRGYKAGFGRIVKGAAFMKRGLMWGLCGLVFGALPAHAVHLFYTDLDDTLFESRRALGGTFSTTFRLFRTTYRANTLQSAPTGLEFIDVSPRDFARLIDRNGRNLLARGEGKPGPIGEKFQLEGGQEFEPWNYMVIEPQSFMTFLPAPADVPEGYFARDLHSALAHEGPGASLRGETYALMQLKLAAAATVSEFGWVTARAHRPEEYRNGFQILHEQTDPALRTGRLPDIRNGHGISGEDYTVLTTSHEITSRKREFYRQQLLGLRRARLTDRDLTTNANGTDRERVHTVVVADDKQSTIDALVALFRGFAMRQAIPLKIVVWNTGLNDEVLARKRPKIAVVKSDGTFRPATVEDLVGRLDVLTDEQKVYLPEIERIVTRAKAMHCGQYITNDGTATPAANSRKKSQGHQE